ncbi:MAG: hypothetical protein HON04_06050, partial [Planctomicrobium sp.]|nr:hypothetical protein [Planctomicrobium sp.]
MPPRKNNSSDQNSSELTLSTEGVREVLGYLNFSSGNDDSAFLKNLNSIWSSLSAESSKLQQVYVGLTDCLTQLHETENAFSEVTQANSVIDLAIQNLMPAYREFHRDLLFHIEPEELENPFFLG